jgi:hypothetical protein
MLGRPEWFTYRMGGWGIAPKTWQGWVYVGVFMALAVGLPSLPIPVPLKNRIMGMLIGLFLADAIVIWVQLGKHHDERQRLHQLIIERNCSFAAVFALLAVMGFRVYQNRDMTAAGAFPFDPLLLAVLGAMVLTKLVSTLYLRWRM